MTAVQPTISENADTIKMQSCPAYEVVHDDIKMQPCPAYEDIHDKVKMQSCPAYSTTEDAVVTNNSKPDKQPDPVNLAFH